MDLLKDKAIYKPNQKYRVWIRSLNCVVCGAPGPSEFAHQRILNGGGTGLKPPDHHGLPECHYCHMLGEHNSGVVTLWKTKRPEMWVDSPDLADPLRGFLYDKQDLREWIEIQCGAYWQLFQGGRAA